MDFDDEARKIFRNLGLRPDGAAASSAATESRPRRIYEDLSLIFTDPKTGGKIFVGNQPAAQSASILNTNDITCVVNCTEDMPNFFEGARPAGAALISYHRFNVSCWMRHVNPSKPERCSST